MKMVIAEKKLAAYAYARALSPSFEEKDGYLIGNNQILYTWAQGHLLQLKDPGELKEEWEVWNWEQLPIYPEQIAFKPIKHQQKQLYLIRDLIEHATLIINAFDCEAEGEFIFRSIMTYLKAWHHPMKRLWTVSLEPSAIKGAFQNLRELSEFDHLGRAAEVRNRLDYLTGINTSRSLSLVGNGQTLPMGRLIGSTLALVHQRESARNQFKETEYYSIKGEFKQGERCITANYSGARIEEIEKLDTILNCIKTNTGTLAYAEQVKEQYPPILLNYTDVVVLMHQRYGLEPIQTGKHLESLYLQGLISYPRTSSRYVTEDEIVTMRATYRILAEVYPVLAKGSNIDLLYKQNARLVNTVSDHHAIIPTPGVPKFKIEEEKWVYQLIVERFFMQVQCPKKTRVRNITIKYNDDLVFKTSEQIILFDGWKAMQVDFSHDEIAENLEEDEIVETVQNFTELTKGAQVELIEPSVKTRKTTPPPAYTEGTLMKQMENVANVVEDKKYKKALQGCGIGTSATRAETIKKLHEIGYFIVEKKKLKVTPLGETVMELLGFEQAAQITTPEMTATWELALNEIKNGQPSEEFEEATKSFISAFIAQMKELSKKQVSTYASRHECPECKAAIKATKKTYRCTKCNFYLWRSQYFKQLTPKMLDDLLKKGETAILTFIGKDKKTKYKAKLEMPADNGKLKMAFLNNK